MNTKILQLAGLLSVISFGATFATSEFRTPISLYRGMQHYPLHYVDDGEWSLDMWSGGYHRSAGKAFMPCNGSDSSTRHTESLAALFFGKPSFRAEQAFAGGILNDVTMPSSNPWLNFANITPRFDYTESGAVVGLHFQRRFKEDKWHVGGRVSIPFKVIEVEQDQVCNLEESLSDVIAINRAPGFDELEYAYRLDFLSALQLNAIIGTDVVPLVSYGDGTSNMSIAGVDVTAATAGDADRAVYAVKRNDGTAPAKNYVKVTGDASGNIDANGSVSAANNAVLRFATATNYLDGLGANRGAQSQLFVVPGQLNGSQLQPGASVIRNVVDSILNILDATGRDSAVRFLNQHCCIDLCRSERTTGVGDLDTELYAGYSGGQWFADGLIGVRFPTGQKTKDGSRVYFQPTGNHRHFEFKVGVEGGWNPRKWFGVHSYFAFSHAFERAEKKAAPFCGACVRNIGPIQITKTECEPECKPKCPSPCGVLSCSDVKITPCVEADVSWNAFQFDIDFTIFHPENPDCGFVFGYELYAKRKDNVEFCEKQFVDCFGKTQALDACILEKDTNTMAHKFRAEVFHRNQYCEIFLGGSHVFAGKFVMKETEAHIGLGINF